MCSAQRCCWLQSKTASATGRLCPLKAALGMSPRLCCLSFRIYTIGTMGDPLHVAVERIKWVNSIKCWKPRHLVSAEYLRALISTGSASFILYLGNWGSEVCVHEAPQSTGSAISSQVLLTLQVPALSSPLPGSPPGKASWASTPKAFLLCFPKYSSQDNLLVWCLSSAQATT